MTEWSMWEAIGTISATIVALFFGLRNEYLKWRNRPQIVLEHFEEGIYVERRPNSSRFMLKIRNKGSMTAKNVQMKLEGVKQNGEIIKPNVYPIDFFNPPISSLQNEDYKFFTFLTIKGNKELHIISELYNKRTSTFNILVTGDNFKAFRNVFEYIDSPHPNMNRLRKKS